MFKPLGVINNVFVSSEGNIETKLLFNTQPESKSLGMTKVQSWNSLTVAYQPQTHTILSLVLVFSDILSPLFSTPWLEPLQEHSFDF